MSSTDGGTCSLGCERKVPLGTRTGICSVCLSNLSFWRRKRPAERLKYRSTLKLREKRLGEIEENPKGYRLFTRNRK